MFQLIQRNKGFTLQQQKQQQDHNSKLKRGQEIVNKSIEEKKTNRIVLKSNDILCSINGFSNNI
jgi:hypothetical protein